MKKPFMRFLSGAMLGYCLAQGLVYLHHNYLWTVFYK